MTVDELKMSGKAYCNLEELIDDPYWNKALDVLFKYSESGRVPATAVDDPDLVLFLEEYSLAFPVSSIYNSLSWRMRLISNSDLEIPYVVRYFFKLARFNFRIPCNLWREAIVRYFEDIGERNPEDFPEIFLKIVRVSRNLIVCGEDIVDISMAYDRDGGVVIAELKGAGLISPSVGCGGYGSQGVSSQRVRAPLYEVNRFFAILAEIDTDLNAKA